jgi:uncharacterized membrane protein YeaQ/YmgE (transglycosylase-associated protein family)
MQELNCEQMENVSGGIVAVTVVGIAGSITANYIYESIGGQEGINSAGAAVGDFLMDVWDNDPILSILFPN